MREIRFRGQAMDLINPGWVYGFYAQIPSNGGLGSFIFDGEEWIEVIGDSVGEFTGLKDKNDKEICEGDIILCDSIRRCPHKIIWTEIISGTLCGTFGWYLSGVSNPGYGFTGGEEVIGNIYENPELKEDN